MKIEIKLNLSFSNSSVPKPIIGSAGNRNKSKKPCSPSLRDDGCYLLNGLYHIYLDICVPKGECHIGFNASLRDEKERKRKFRENIPSYRMHCLSKWNRDNLTLIIALLNYNNPLTSKWHKSVRKSQIPYNSTRMWNLREQKWTKKQKTKKQTDF